MKRVRDITAGQRPRMGTIGTELIDKEQQVHVTLHETNAEAPSVHLIMCGAVLGNRTIKWCK